MRVTEREQELLAQLPLALSEEVPRQVVVVRLRVQALASETAAIVTIAATRAVVTCFIMGCPRVEMWFAFIIL